MSDTETISPAAEAWLSGNMDKAQELNQPIPDDGPAAAPLAGEVPTWLHQHNAAQPDSQPSAAPQQEAALITRAATTLAELGPEGQALVQEWGGHTSPDFKENFAFAREAFRDIAKNRPDLIAKVDASGLGDDPAVLKVLAELGRGRATTLGDRTVSNRYSNDDSRPLPSGNSAAQRELDAIYKKTPPGSEGYRARDVQARVQQLNEMIHGTGPAVGLGGRTR
ncbi:hypothetical protein [Bradyrhizobium sp. RT3a]|uniref:hypothetical protein n=1 Tax=unclassified Bradyrhizobium TaxID=2631580 RepID=UPI003391006E